MNSKICIGVLSWNSIDDLKNLISSIFKEIKGNDSYSLIVVDNGSIDGTIDYLMNLSINVVRLTKNHGIGIAKNIFINYAIDIGADYLIMFDSDVMVIPESFKFMINWMEKNEKVACLGQHIDFYSKNAGDPIIPCFFPEKFSIEYNIKSGCGATRAWTHYSIYRVDIFKLGVKFDTADVFGQPGYGFDDDDLGMQIISKGYDIACFKDVYCYHNVNSSIPKLKLDNSFNMGKREQYFKTKWARKLGIYE